MKGMIRKYWRYAFMAASAVAALAFALLVTGWYAGFSSCWWLSETCSVNWDAWSAIGTVAAVFAAIFAPAIQNKMIRKKANALFALAYTHDLIRARSSLFSFDKLNPIGQSSPEGEALDKILRCSQEARNAYSREICDVLQGIASRDVDITKWPAVDLGLASDVVLAIDVVKAIRVAASVLAKIPDERVDSVIGALRKGIDHANFVLERAELSTTTWAEWLSDNRNREIGAR